MQKAKSPSVASSKPSLFLYLSLEPGALLGLVSGRHATNELSLVGVTLLTSGFGFDGCTGIHSRKGNILLSFLAVTANDAGTETIKLGAGGGKFKVRWEVLFQQIRAVAL